MLVPSNLEQVAAEIVRSREARIARFHLLSQLPPRTPVWRRGLGSLMERSGARLARWGEWLAQREVGLGLPLPGRQPQDCESKVA